MGWDGVRWGAVAPPGRGLRPWLSPQPDALPAKGREQQLSNRSIVSLADSHTEFFDACEVFLSASSSENEVRGLGGLYWLVGGLCWLVGGSADPPPPLGALDSSLPSLSPVPPHQPAREPLPASPPVPVFPPASRSSLRPRSRALRTL